MINRLFRNYIWKLINRCQSWPLWPTRLRMWFLRISGVSLHPSAWIAEGVYLGATNLVMGAHTAINVGSFIDGNAEVILEDYSRVGPFVKILTGTHESRRSAIRRWPGDPTVAKRVHIKKGCWLGMGSMVLPGIVVEEGCIIGAGAVVTESTLPHGLYVGVPAKRIRDLPCTEDFSSDSTGKK